MSADKYQLSGKLSQSGKSTLYGEQYNLLGHALSQEVKYTTEPSVNAPLRRKYKKRDDIMRYIHPIGGDSLRRDLCSNNILDVLQSKVLPNRLEDEEKKEEELSKEDRKATEAESLASADSASSSASKTVGEAVIGLQDCLMTEYHVVSDLDIGEVNMAGIFQGRHVEEHEESLKHGEIIQLCSSKHIQNAIKWLERYGTHFVRGVSMGCEVTQKFRIQKDDMFTNPYMHPSDYIQTILSRQNEDQRAKTNSRASATKIKNGHPDDGWYLQEDVVELPSNLHKSKVPSMSAVPRFKSRGDDEDDDDDKNRRRRRLLTETTKKKKHKKKQRRFKDEKLKINNTNFIGETFEEEQLEWQDSITDSWIESKGGNIAYLPENVKDITNTDLSTFWASCYHKPAVLSRDLENIVYMLLGEGDTLDACVLDKRYQDVYKSICTKSCEQPNASPKEWSKSVFENKYEFSAANTDGSGFDGGIGVQSNDNVEYRKECHSDNAVFKNGCIGTMERLNTRIPKCAQWYFVPVVEGTQVDPNKPSLTFDAAICMKCAEACVKNDEQGFCISEQCRLNIKEMDTNEEPYDYIRGAKLAEGFYLAAKRVRTLEQKAAKFGGYRRKMLTRANKGIMDKLDKAGLPFDPYGRALMRKTRMLENVATFLRIKSKSLMLLNEKQLVEEEKAMESLRSMRELMLISRRAILKIENSGPKGQYPVITPELLWSKIQTIYESSKDIMPMVNFLDSVLMFLTQRFYLTHRVAFLCGKEREKYVRTHRLHGLHKINKRMAVSSYNGGFIFEKVLDEEEMAGGHDGERTGQENSNDPEVVRDIDAKYNGKKQKKNAPVFDIEL